MIIPLSKCKFPKYQIPATGSAITGSEADRSMWSKLAELVRAGHLREPLHRLVPLEEFSEALARSMEPYASQKQILILNEHFRQK